MYLANNGAVVDQLQSAKPKPRKKLIRRPYSELTSMLTAAAAATACANSPPHPDMTAPCWVDSTTVSPPVKPKCDYESSATMARRTAHRHSHPSSHCTAHNESQYQPRSFSLKCAPIPEHHNRECHDEKCPTSNPIPPQLLCGAVIPENVRSHIGRRRIGSTSALPSGGIQRRHTSGTSASARHIGRRSCGGAVPEDESNMHQLLCQCRSCNSTMFQKQACKCVRCNQLLFLYAFASNRRVSNITFSTVTSATGLPTIAAEPSRPRSSSYWKPQQHIKQECSVTSASVPHIPSDNGSGGGVQMTGKTECKSTVNNIKSTDDSTELATASRKSEEENALTSSVAVSSLPSQSTAIAQTVQQQNKIGGANSSKLFNNITGNLKDGSASTTPISSPQFRRLEGLQNSNKNVTTSGVEANPTSNHVPSTAEEQLERRRRPPLRLNDTSANKAVNFHKKHLKHTESKITEEEADLSSEQSTSSGATEDSQLLVIKTADGNVFDRSELERDEYLRRISEWGFPIFAFAERHNRTVLSRITYAIFKEANLFRIFKLSPTKFFNFFHSLESGYWDIPYHNRIHAADVLHGTFYLTCHPVRAFVGRPSTPETPEIALDSAPLPLSQSMNTLELMALFTAAAMHDFDHPGRTNAFLVASEDKKAILYNDRSVLENHHAAESWRLLCQSQNNFIENLDSAETKRFRYLVLEYILATDLKQHFDIIMQFNEKAPDIDLTNESDRVLLSQMLIKFADINSPAKPYPLHRQWTERICQEFYEQGDEEQQRKMPVSPYMDRQHPAVAKLQDSFIAHIVNPLAVALNEAGLLPVLPGLEEPELIINLKHNHSKWLYEIEEEQSSFEGESTTSEEGSVIENNSVLNQNNNCENKSNFCVSKTRSNGPTSKRPVTKQN